ncbi:hypothetical protein BASA50_003570 [Batrachochytrium salamandrivorans]|uniref:Uncharacterized protein n=1 Tax=Batrachochytrium salamandrivorans TaxID=1357716 RepID=A0ABQ8FHT8_9FUNG|nr:hypothetical protein BASA60_008023 [Batrachochytrium salamandrivorans]KAH6598531.1 hypothetical protein BASA50_003570 [Batrachochytrium salamandrivorans]KAH6602102.1 hypothetical protein BASA61_001471 [Batrachochytrium salamandrivorans]KAH9266602.1 hypothetical protein BASA84_001090 [Batrachochytrium salamandrivorans]
MRLISFAVISLLAITVSAQPPQNTGAQGLEGPQSAVSQDLEGPQSTTAQILLGNPQQSLLDRLNKLLEDYKAKEHDAGILDYGINIIETEKSDVESKANALDEPERIILNLHLIRVGRALVIIQEFKKTICCEMEVILKELHDVIREMSASNETQQ